MAVRRFGEMSWEQVRALDRQRTVALLPVGAIEAHGPHLPLETDVIIAEAMAESGAAALAARGCAALVLPPLSFTSAPFARAFAGTMDVSPTAVGEQVVGIAESLSAHDFGALAIANSHFDPTHLRCLHEAVAGAGQRAPELAIVFPDVTRRPWAGRLTEEFRSGACHAGCYESSIVLARRPDLVDRATAENLPENPRSLSRAIGEGLESFEAAGGPDAYFGAPAAASAGEGRRTIATLGEILCEAVLDAFPLPTG